jgi:predicted amidophosphoribosyltransferase
MGCARCGNLSCSGCEAISEFSQVKSLYLYQDLFANILIHSKENDNINTQKVFEELFFIPLKNSIINFISKEGIDCIVISPLRKERILKSSWHPNLFFEKVILHLMEKEFKEKQELHIFYPHYTKPKRKQSLIPSNIRKEKTVIETELLYLNKFVYENKNILLLDDVLTSGESAILCRQLSAEKFPHAKWNLLTILRAPQVLSTKSN